MLKIKNGLDKPHGFVGTLAYFINNKPENVYLVLAIVFGVIAAIITPPLQIPDETAHYVNTLKVSHGQFLPSVVDGKIGIYISEAEAQFAGHYYVPELAEPMQFSDFFEFESDYYRTSVFFADSVAAINSFAYAVPGIGLAVFRFIFPFFNPYICFIFARLCNLALAIFLTRQAIKVTPILKNTMLLLALMPMTVQQSASLSYDSILIAASFVFFAYLMKIIYEKDDYIISVGDIVMMLAAVAILFATKFVYGAFIVALLAIPKKKIGSWKKYLILAGAVIAIAVIFYYVPSRLNSAISASVRTPNPLAAENNAIFFENPILNSVKILFGTTVTWFGMWCIQFYGSLGWLAISLPLAVIIAFYVVLALVFLTEISQAGALKPLTRFLLWAAFFVPSLGAMLGIYLQHNTKIGYVGGSVAYGVQGRYFIPVVLFGFAIFANSLFKRFKHREKLNCIAEKSAYVMCLISCITAVVAVYLFHWFKISFY